MTHIFNVSNIKNQVIDIGKQRFLFEGDRQVIREGNSINSWFGYIFDGIYQSQQEIIDGPKRAEPVAPGDLKYKDISGINRVLRKIFSFENYVWISNQTFK